MSLLRSSRYDFGNCEVDYVTESDFYSSVTIRFRQIDGDDEAQLTLHRVDVHELLGRLGAVLSDDPTGLISAQLHGQKMATKGTQ